MSCTFISFGDYDRGRKKIDDGYKPRYMIYMFAFEKFENI
jgi:hypothetical protein